jgi:hypothetical protein
VRDLHDVPAVVADAPELERGRETGRVRR